MNLLASNHLILLGLRSFSAISPIWSWILFHESMALKVIENFPKLFVQKDFFMKMAFYRGSCTTVVNIVVELKPVFKDRRKHVIQCFFNENKVFYHSLSLNFRIIFFWKKGLEWEFQGWNYIILITFFVV